MVGCSSGLEAAQPLNCVWEWWLSLVEGPWGVDMQQNVPVPRWFVFPGMFEGFFLLPHTDSRWFALLQALQILP